MDLETVEDNMPSEGFRFDSSVQTVVVKDCKAGTDVNHVATTGSGIILVIKRVVGDLPL